MCATGTKTKMELNRVWFSFYGGCMFRFWNPIFKHMSLFRLAIIHLWEPPESKTTWFINEIQGQNKTVFLFSLWLEKIRTNRTYVRKSRYVKHGLGYCDFVYHKQQRHEHRNPTITNDRHDHRNPTKNIVWNHIT